MKLSKQVAEQVAEELRKHFKKISSMGGTARAAKHSKKELQEWARLGGRPKRKVQPRRKAKGK